ncbi:DNA-binding transcriptional MocR family regulator [Sphingopyxis sp. OAS728]|uniref:aminotransferase-like domain-containing protein n=1 Tax=Sphingopyxis sp. OAS728 TaxID=2663823 RepID=UPI00178AD5D2|nr:PLP-dependent aminotransferase family protein [Sphingopyxis sp. OAS728]MBE1528628.1 DNA-binding transcriptional MocR family regulator [Sphingopyxis sp. OAS728]
MAADAWLPDIAGAAGPKYKAVTAAISAAVARGDLRHGDRLPPQRDLAVKLGIDLTTVTKAYDLARQRGLIVARGRAGSFISEDVRTGEVATAAQSDIAMNSPPIPIESRLTDAMASALGTLARADGLARLHYQRPGGAAADRESGAELLARMGLSSSVEQIVVTAGGQNGLHAVASTMLKPGDRVACGRFVYPGFAAIARRMGVTLVPLAEMAADALEAAHAVAPLRALYVVPTNDNPTTATLTVKERRDIAAWAQDARVQVIEDDAYGLLPDAPIPAIASFAPEVSWHVASMAKIISPALRVGFVRAPGVAEAMQIASCQHESAVMAPPLNVAMISLWLADGTFDTLVDAVRKEAIWRQRLAHSVLGDGRHNAHPQGYHLWLPLADDSPPDVLAAALALDGLSAVPSNRFAVAPGAPKAVRISLGGTIDRRGLSRALHRLAAQLWIPGGAASHIV